MEGEAVIRDCGITPCLLDEAQRNILPDLPEPFRCQWAGCPVAEEEFPQAQHFYWHVAWHAEEYRGEKDIKCLWLDCASTFKTVSKLKDHLRTHTQVS